MNLIEVTLNGIKRFVREDLFSLWNKTGWERIQEAQEPKVSEPTPVKKTRTKKVKDNV